MKLTLNGKKNGNGHRNGHGASRRWAQLALLVMAVLLVFVLLYRQVERLRGPKQAVWVASTNLAAGSVLTEDAVERAELRESKLPENAVVADADLSGQRLARPKREGEPITAGDVQRRSETRQERAASLAELLPAGRVLASVRVDLQSVIMGELRFGDRFSLLAAGPGQADVVAQDAYFLAWIDPALLAGGSGGGGGNGGAPQESGGFLSSLLELPPGAGGTGGEGGGGGDGGTTEMLLALYPQDVLPVSQAQATGGALSLVIHGQKEIKAGRMLSLETSRVRDVELIEGDDQEVLQFQR